MPRQAAPLPRPQRHRRQLELPFGLQVLIRALEVIVVAAELEPQVAGPRLEPL